MLRRQTRCAQPRPTRSCWLLACARTLSPLSTLFQVGPAATRCHELVCTPACCWHLCTGPFQGTRPRGRMTRRPVLGQCCMRTYTGRCQARPRQQAHVQAVKQSWDILAAFQRQGSAPDQGGAAQAGTAGRCWRKEAPALVRGWASALQQLHLRHSPESFTALVQARPSARAPLHLASRPGAPAAQTLAVCVGSCCSRQPSWMPGPAAARARQTCAASGGPVLCACSGGRGKGALAEHAWPGSAPPRAQHSADIACARGRRTATPASRGRCWPCCSRPGSRGAQLLPSPHACNAAIGACGRAGDLGSAPPHQAPHGAPHAVLQLRPATPLASWLACLGSSSCSAGHAAAAVWHVSSPCLAAMQPASSEPSAAWLLVCMASWDVSAISALQSSSRLLPAPDASS